MLAADAVITYEFRDASVPPPDHRSFVITVDHTQTRIVVDSYGDVLADRSAPTPQAVWNRLGDTVGSLSDIVINEPEQGCTGGTSFVLSIKQGGSTSLALSGTECGGANSNAAQRLTDWIPPAQTLFPPMSQLAP